MILTLSLMMLALIYWYHITTDKHINYMAVDLKKVKLNPIVRSFFPHKKIGEQT